ncbi:hypothetical protein N2152v2_002161 [Parachlorella kessleri]
MAAAAGIGPLPDQGPPHPLPNLSQARIILGSASTSRKGIMDEVAKEYGFTYEVCTADIDEKAIREPDPKHLVIRLAHAKAEAIRAKLLLAGTITGLLLTCDQVVVHEGRILEKPHDAAEARQFIDGYGRSPAQTVGSVVVTDLDTGLSYEGVDVATIHFEPLPSAAVETLIAEGDVLWCAGGLMVEHPLVQPHVTRMEGTLDAVMGLPKALVLRLLRKALAPDVDGPGAAS